MRLDRTNNLESVEYTMLKKMWEVKKETMLKPYNKLSKAELVIDSLWLDFVSAISVDNGRVVYTMITGEVFSNE